MVEKTTKFSGRTVNSQITDAITQTNALTIGIAPAQSMATLYQTMSHSTGTAMQNAVANQQNMYSLNLASLTQNLQAMMESGPAMRARAVQSLNSNRMSSGDMELMELLRQLMEHQQDRKIRKHNAGDTSQAASASPAAATETASR